MKNKIKTLFTFAAAVMMTASLLSSAGCASVKNSSVSDSVSEVSSETEKVDAAAPAFTLSEKEVTITAGDAFDPLKYISSDGGLKLVKKEPVKNADGLYDTGWYMIDSDVKTDTAGKYTVIYHAESREGKVTEKTLKVTVKEKEVKKETSSKKTEADNAQSQKKSVPKQIVQEPQAETSSSAQSIPSSGTDSYNGVIQADDCPKVKVHHDAITETKQIEHRSDPVVEVWYTFSDGTEFSTYDEASAYQSSNNAGSFISFLKCVQESQCTYETVEEVVVPAYDEYVCQ